MQKHRRYTLRSLRNQTRSTTMPTTSQQSSLHTGMSTGDSLTAASPLQRENHNSQNLRVSPETPALRTPCLTGSVPHSCNQDIILGWLDRLGGNQTKHILISSMNTGTRLTSSGPQLILDLHIFRMMTILGTLLDEWRTTTA